MRVNRVNRWPLAVKAEAMRLCIEEVRGPKTISAKLNVPFDTVRAWIKTGKWVQQRREVAKSNETAIISRACEVVKRQRASVLERHLMISEALDRALLSKLVDIEVGADGAIRVSPKVKIDLDPEDLARLARAAKSSSDIAARVVGIGRTNARSLDAVVIDVDALPEQG